MSKYFELREFITSNTAKQLGIDNTPTFEVVENLNELATSILDPLRKDWGSGIRVSSGYRCPELNKAVGGSSTSAHKRGEASDLQPVNGEFVKFAKFCQEWFKAHKDSIPFDQVILEKSGPTRWVHVGLRNAKGKQRKQVFSLNL